MLYGAVKREPPTPMIGSSYDLPVGETPLAATEISIEEDERGTPVKIRVRKTNKVTVQGDRVNGRA